MILRKHNNFNALAILPPYHLADEEVEGGTEPKETKAPKETVAEFEEIPPSISDIVVTYDIDPNTELWFSPGEPVEICISYKPSNSTKKTYEFYDYNEWNEAILPFLTPVRKDAFKPMAQIIEEWT